MQVCVFTDEISKDFHEAVRLARDAGADAVEIRGGLFGKDVTRLTPAELLEISRIVADHGMRVASLASPFGKCDLGSAEVREHQEMLQRVIEAGKVLNCWLIRGFAFWNPNGAAPPTRACLPAYLEAAANALRPAVVQAAAGGFVFGLELAAETLVATASEYLMLANALGNNPAFQVVWDLDAELQAGELPMPTGYQQLRGRIAHVHVKPNAEGLLTTVRNSDVTTAEALLALRSDGFSGAVSIEHWGSPDRMLDGVRQLRVLLDQIRITG